MAEPTDAADPKAPLGDAGLRKNAVPQSFPPWARKLAELYYSGTTSSFVVHGNVLDLFGMPGSGQSRWTGIGEYMAEQVFGRWDLVLHYDLARGLRCLAGGSGKRLVEMVTLANKWIGDLTQLPREPARA